MAIVKDLGMVTAYAYAVAGGYEGTEAEFTELLGQAGVTLEQLENLSAVAVTLSPGSEATASYSDGVLTFGIPQGATGETGQTGPQGPEGPTGNGISSIAKTGTSGLIDTYTITFTNGTTTTFTVTNGEDGSVTPEQMAAAIADALDTFSGETHEYLTAGMAEQLLSDVVTTDKKPYLFRRTGADATREFDTLVGGSVVGNQLVNGANLPQTQTISDITFTNNGNGSITVSGTASDTVGFDIAFVTNVPTGHKIMMYHGVTGGSWGTYAPMFNYNGVQIDYSKPGAIYDNSNTTVRLRTQVWAGTTVNFTIYPQLFDLTKMLPSAIADYAYTLEQQTAGSGIAWLKSYGFFTGYQAYNSGSMVHVSGVSEHVMTGFNQWNEEWEVGGFYTATGLPWATSDRIRSKNAIPVIPGAEYYIAIPNGANSTLFFYDKNDNFISTVSRYNQTFTVPGNAAYMKFNTGAIYGTTYKNDICINLSNPAKNGTYKPYTVNSYTLDDTLTLRGIPKLSNGEIYYDGDTYAHDGTVTRRYGLVDLGTLTWNYSQELFVAVITGVKKPSTQTERNKGFIFSSTYMPDTQTSIASSSMTNKTALIYNGSENMYIKDTSYTDAATFKASLSGVYLLYELQTPTTETASSYQSPQICDPDGTEQYITDGIPVGHDTQYPANLKGEIERVMVQVPKPPTSNGTYTLKCTVASSGTTYAWTT